MRVGIIAEGRSDFAVLANILKGKLGINRNQLTPLRPRFALDETDLAVGRGPQQPDEYSNYALVLADCSAPHDKLLSFLDTQIAEERFVVVHIDTDKCHTPEIGVVRPPRKPKEAAEGYTAALRGLVAAKIEALLGAELSKGVCLAVAVEETEAWLLTLWDPEDPRDTGLRLDPKKYFRECIVDGAKKTSPRARDRGEKDHDYFDHLSQGFRDGARLAVCAGRNASLGLFVESLAGRGLTR